MTKIEKARIDDAPLMHKLVNHFAETGDMLPRPLAEIYETIRDFFVARQEGELVGCAALHVNWSDLAEIKSLAVDESRQGSGIGTQLAKACLKEARELGIPTVFALARKPAFFLKLGFREVDVMTLPLKVWSECYRCPKYPGCDEVAVVLELNPEDPA
ncbi:MAG: N-acetyltransferase [Chloroflexi bacterium]|nr:N-acetyltransferase [Chloroflexota bacterium]